MAKYSGDQGGEHGESAGQFLDGSEVILPGDEISKARDIGQAQVIRSFGERSFEAGEVEEVFKVEAGDEEQGGGLPASLDRRGDRLFQDFPGSFWDRRSCGPGV